MSFIKEKINNKEDKSKEIQIYSVKKLPTNDKDKYNLRETIINIISNEKCENILRRTKQIPHDPENFEVIPFIECLEELKSFNSLNSLNTNPIHFGIKPTEYANKKLLCKIATDAKYWRGFSNNLKSWVIIRRKDNKKNIFVFDTGKNEINSNEEINKNLEQIKEVLHYFVNLYYAFKCEKLWLPYRPFFVADMKDDPIILSINFSKNNTSLKSNPYTEMGVLIFKTKKDMILSSFNISPLCSAEPFYIRNMNDTYSISDNSRSSICKYFTKLEDT